MFNRINESFDRNFKPIVEETLTTVEELKRALDRVVDGMEMAGNNNLKTYEMLFQDEIEKFYPGNSWWEVTDCNIFMDLFNERNPRITVEHIIDEIKPEFKGDGGDVDEPIKESLLQEIHDDLERLKKLYGPDFEKAFGKYMAENPTANVLYSKDEFGTFLDWAKKNNFKLNDVDEENDVEIFGESIDDTSIQDVEKTIDELKSKYPNSDVYYDGDSHTIKISLDESLIED